MTKADIVSNVSKNLGIEKIDVQLTVESVMKEIISSLENGENVYLRGFGSFIVKKRAEKTGRNIKNNTLDLRLLCNSIRKSLVCGGPKI